jgi:FMN phosphatase YigB (HAD superfamily)
VGDRVRDVLPAETFGALGILVHSRPQAEDENASRFAHASDLRAAVDLILDQQS